MDAARATARFSDAVGREHRVVGPLTGGETGATEIVDADGARFVIKWEPDPDNATARRVGLRLAERLRFDAGWPSPRQRSIEADGVLVVVQELLPGDPMTRLDHATVDALLALHERRLPLTTDEPNDWAEEMVAIVAVGGRGYCLHEPLRTHDARTRRIVERIEEIGRSLAVDDVAGDGIVHGDLHLGNLLAVDRELSAVIDMDYTRVGDPTFDLTTLAVSSLEVDTEPGVVERLFALGVDALPEPKRLAYLSNLLLRCLDWPIRKGRIGEVDFWVPHAERLLAV